MKQETTWSRRFGRRVPWILDCCGKSAGEGTCTPLNLRQNIDHDYLDKLSPEELKWLADFDDSYYTGASNQVSKEFTVEEKRACYNRNNKRLRDFWNNSYHTMLKDWEESGSYSPDEDPGLTIRKEIFEIIWGDTIRETLKKISHSKKKRAEFLLEMTKAWEDFLRDTK